MKTLRPHQEKAIDMLRCSLKEVGKRPMLCLPTGAGKTLIAAHIIGRAVERGVRCLFVVDAISLIDQTVRAFWAEGLQHVGVIQADHPMTDYSKPIQVASVQTLQRRGMPKDIGMVVVDEAHGMNDWLLGVMASDEWKRVPFIGLSATPWAKGLGHHYDNLLQPISMRELIALGYLSPFRVFAPSHPDLSKVSTVAGDYHEGELAKVMGDEVLIADIVRTWRQLGDNRPTLAFCVDRAHAKKIQKRFEEAGIGCGYIDAHTPRDEREAIRKQLEAGQLRVVANVGCLTKGVDWAIGCIILARPTRSEMLFVQIVGRGLRVNPGMDDCIILDHSDNTLRLGFVTDIRRDQLCEAKKGEKQRQERQAPLPKECPKCAYVKAPKVHECPSCGFKPEKRSDIEEANGVLVEMSGRGKPKPADKAQFYRELIGLAHMRGKSQSWALAHFRAKFNEWPHKKQGVQPATPTPATVAFVQSRMIAWAKGKSRAA